MSTTIQGNSSNVKSTKPIQVLGRLYTGPMLCVYASECLAFLRFLKG